MDSQMREMEPQPKSAVMYDYCTWNGAMHNRVQKKSMNGSAFRKYSIRE